MGELIPKRMGMLRAEKIARVVAGPINVLSAITYPVIWLLNLISNLFFKLINIKPASDSAVTEEEIKAMITEGSEHGTIEEEEKEIIERVFHLGDRKITALMTHRTEIVWFDEEDTVQKIIDQSGDIIYSTYPVCNKTVDDIKGIIYIKELLKADTTAKLGSLVKPALFVPENNTPYQLLEKIKAVRWSSPWASC